VKVVIAQAVHAAAGVVAKVTPKVDTASTARLTRSRLRVVAQKVRATAVALRAPHVVVQTAPVTAQMVHVTAVGLHVVVRTAPVTAQMVHAAAPVTVRPRATVAARHARAAKTAQLSRRAKVHRVGADQGAAHVQPESPAAAVAPTVKSNSAVRELLQS
jgi:hypothetical protein